MKYLKDYLQKINEGLIKSTPSGKYTLHLINLFGSSPYIYKTIEELVVGQIKVEVDYINKIVDIDNFFDLIDSTCNINGYFVNKIYVTNVYGNENSFYYIDNTINYIKNNKSSIQSIIFLMESKFNIVNNLPSKLYHISIKSYKEKILKKGIVPKSNSKLAYHPPRIYLTESPDDCEDLIPKMKGIYYSNYNKNKQYDFVIFEIDTSDLDIKLFSDPNFNGYYTQDNIPPDKVRLYKEIAF